MSRSLIAFVFAVVLFNNTQKIEAADYRQGVQVVFTNHQLLLEGVGELLFKQLEVRLGIVLMGYDPYDNPNRLEVTNGISLTTSWIFGPKESKLAIGLGNRFMLDEEDSMIQVYPEIGYVYWGRDIRIKLAIGGGGQFNNTRSDDRGWNSHWLLSGLFGVTF